MTTEQFEGQLRNLIANAPKEAIIMLSYSNLETQNKIEFVQGNGLDLVADLSLFLTDKHDMQEVFGASLEASRLEMTKMFKHFMQMP
jgi:hypothetical protein